MVLGGPKVLPQWRKAKLRHGRNLRKYMQHGDTANTAKYMGTVLDQACMSAVAAVSVVPPCSTAFWLMSFTPLGIAPGNAEFRRRLPGRS